MFKIVRRRMTDRTIQIIGIVGLILLTIAVWLGLAWAMSWL
jgi:hypothetical protein